MTETLTKPRVSVQDETYRFAWDCGIEAELDRVAEHRDELSAEVTIRSSREPRPGLLHSARLNLMSTQARKTLASALTDRDPDIDWPGLVEQMCFLTRERYRSGEPSVDLRTHTPSDASRWLLEPFIESDGPCVTFADGGSGKSLFAQAVSVSIASGVSVVGRLHGDPRPVLYLDWETSGDAVHERVEAIARGAEISPFPAVYYRRQYASLAESASEIRREIRRLGVGFVVVDSLGAARAGEPESADVTIRLFNAARSLGVPWLGIDHVTKAIGNQGSRPFGSTFTHNLARITWGADKAQEAGENSLVIALKNHKRNNGRLLPTTGYRLDFVSTSDDRLWTVRFLHTDITRVPELAGKVSLSSRILAELSSGPLAQVELAEALAADIHAVSARVGELERRQKVIRLEDKRVALRAAEA